MTATRPSTSVESARERLDAALERIDRYTDPAVWISRFSSVQVYQQLADAMHRQASGADQPLLGLTFAVKDNIDVFGLPTTAACPQFAYDPKRSATVVQRLCDAGALVIGKTNMDQFATGLVGTRTPHGACKNVFNPAYISGGSSSGSGVAVAGGLVDFSLGTDTAGSGRVPAAFGNIVGVKPSRGWLSNHGLVPACRSLDCISVFAADCTLAERVVAVAAGFDAADVYSSDLTLAQDLETFTVGVPNESDLEFFGNDDMRELYTRSIDRLKDIGGRVVTFDLKPFLRAAKLLYEGPWVAERWAAVGSFYQSNPTALLPVLQKILDGAKRFSAADAFEGMYRLQALKRETQPTWELMDLMLLPTTGTIYTIAEVQADPIRLNSNLGYYTNFVNLLDLSGVALPAGFMPNGLPGGVTLIAPAGADYRLLHLGQRFQTTKGNP